MDCPPFSQPIREELRELVFRWEPDLTESVKTIKLTSIDQLDRSAFRALLHQAVRLDHSPALPRPPKQKREPLPMPPHLVAALKKNRPAAAFFDSLKPTYQHEYFAWNTFIKTPEAKARRLEETIQALATGRKWAQRKLAWSGPGG